MNKKNYLIMIAILFIAIGTGCKKDSEGNPVIPGITTSMTAKIDGLDWFSVIRTSTRNANLIVINGVSADGKIIEINISPNIGTENLVINKDFTIPITSFYKKQITITTDDIYFATTGTVRLTSFDITNKMVSGTFNFSAISINFGTATIASGTFTNVSYVGN